VKQEAVRDLTTAEGILESVFDVPALLETAALLRGEGTGVRAAWTGLQGAARAWALAALHRATGKPFVWVLAGAEEADGAREDLEYFLGRDGVLGFPEPETPPYESHGSHPDVSAQRLQTLLALSSGSRAPVVTTVRALAQRVPGPEIVARGRLTLSVTEDYDLDGLISRLAALGYERHPMVSAIGEFALRGGILDLFPVGAENPWRLEFDDITLSSMRSFDVFSQRSIEPFAEGEVLPRFEVSLLPEDLPLIHSRLERAAEEAGERGPVTASEQTVAMAHKLLHEGVERLAGHYDQQLTELWTYLDPSAVVVADSPERLAERAATLDQEVASHYREAKRHYAHLSPPEELFVPAQGGLDRRGQRPLLSLITARRADSDAPVWSWDVRPQEAFGRRIELVRSHLERLHGEGLSSVILCDNPGQMERMGELLGECPGVIGVGILSAGFVSPQAGLAVLTDHQIYERPRRRRRRGKRSGGLSLSELNALNPGDRVVHADHGIGIYQGLRRLVIDGQETDCLELSYAAGDKLYVPVTQLNLVSRYSSEESAAPTLHRLGSPTWAKTKARARRAIQDMTQELLRAYAERHANPGHAFPPDTPWQKELEASFIYEETPDQMRAVNEVKADMEDARPMDRLVCGDVGYGKTEVAVRAAFKAIEGGKQVAVLVPTTILAQQHFNTFRERLAEFPVKIEMLSRFRTAGDQKKVAKAVSAGQVDIVIGTHRLLSKDVEFADLGLVVIDEEQRFGVRHKERIRQMSKQVDVLTLSATPIPRTLNFSLAGARDMSLIETPPRDRHPVLTEIVETSEELIVEGLLRELERGGQAFFVHNRVETIDTVAVRLTKLLPQLRFAIAHGQMRERALEKVMMEFYQKKHDVLICTMIVENGLDLPNANTLMVDRADTLGLAQLYQLRGRVGRSRARAYAYFMVPPGRVLTEEAEKRLKIIEAFDELGAGFRVALKDMEIRGAGNLLGAEQHGFMLGLGFDLYIRLLEETVAEVKGEDHEQKIEPRLHTDRAAFLPETYVADDEEKLEVYRRLAHARRLETVDELVGELRDRFGPMPFPVLALLNLRRLRLLGAEGGISRMTLEGEVFEAWLHRPLTPQQIAMVVNEAPEGLEFLSGKDMGLRLRAASTELVDAARILLEALAACASVRPK
jgi:transcription-repair coupling factor (superfamily II helicase)